MSFEVLDLFCNDRVGVNVEAFLDAISAIDGVAALTATAFNSPPIAVAALSSRRPCGITAARTFRGGAQPKTARLGCPRNHVLVTIALEDADVSLVNDGRSLIETISADAVCLTGPGSSLEMRMRGACDLLHLAVPLPFLRWPAGRQSDVGAMVLRDALIGRIARLLCDAPAGWLYAYAEVLSQLAVARILQLAPELSPSRLPVWRLKKVQAFVEANISGPIRLGDLAAVSGLSRMHFAAQFRAATGLRPHDYVLSRRIEHAKRLISGPHKTLVEVALDAGFQSQAHFCFVFKHLTGLTPSTWRGYVSARELSPAGGAAVERPDPVQVAAFSLRFSVQQTDRWPSGAGLG